MTIHTVTEISLSNQETSAHLLMDIIVHLYMSEKEKIMHQGGI
jgi:hypothetical protein